METPINKEPLSKVQSPLINTWVTVLLYLLSVFIVLIIVGSAGGFLSFLLPKNILYGAITTNFISTISLLIAAFVPAVLFTRYIDKQPLAMLGLGIKGRARECLYGILFAFLLYGVGFGVSLLLGVVKIVSITFNYQLLFVSLLFFLIAAFVEEIMVRGYIQGRLMLKINRFAALIVSSFIFSALHLMNPGLGALPLINLFLAGILFGVYCMYVRNLWFPTFLHAFWNWIQGPVLGYEVSGTNLFPSSLTIRLTGSDLLTGGKFGFEGSIICTLILIVAILLMILWFERRKKSCMN